MNAFTNIEFVVFVVVIGVVVPDMLLLRPLLVAVDSLLNVL